MPHRRRRALAPVATAVFVIASTASAAAAGARSDTSPAPALSDQAVAALSPAAQASRLQPLRRLAGDLDALGRSAWSGDYGGVSLDAGHELISLFVTELAAGRALMAAAEKADPAAAWADVRLRTAPFSAARLDEAARALIGSRSRPARVTSIAVPVGGSGLDVDVAAAPATAPASAPAAAPAAVDGVPVHVHVTAAATAKSWAADKWHDSSPFIGGDMLTSTGHNGCTAGLPAVVRSTGKPVMITAAHCFSVGTRVYTGAGTPGNYGNGLTGNYVGTVTARNTTWDAEELVGAGNNADESDTYGWKPLTSVAYSYVGDYVCQNGAASYYLGHPTPCGIKVTDQDLWFPIGGYWARGVQGVDVLHGWGSHGGDSGGTVFAVEPGGVRQARGIISSGGADGTSAQKIVDWTEAVDIFRAFGLKLNPQT